MKTTRTTSPAGRRLTVAGLTLAVLCLSAVTVHAQPVADPPQPGHPAVQPAQPGAQPVAQPPTNTADQLRADWFRILLDIGGKISPAERDQLSGLIARTFRLSESGAGGVGGGRDNTLGGGPIANPPSMPEPTSSGDSADGITLGASANKSGDDGSASPFVVGFLQTRSNSTLSFQINVLGRNKVSGEVDTTGLSVASPPRLRVNALNDQRTAYGERLIDPLATRGATFRYSTTAVLKPSTTEEKTEDAANAEVRATQTAFNQAEDDLKEAQTAAATDPNNPGLQTNVMALTQARTLAARQLSDARAKAGRAKRVADPIRERRARNYQVGFYVRANVSMEDWQAKVTEDAPADTTEAQSRGRQTGEEPTTQTYDRTISGSSGSSFAFAGGLMFLSPPVGVLTGEPVTIGMEIGYARRAFIGNLAQEDDFREAIFGTRRKSFSGYEVNIFALSGDRQFFVRFTNFDGGVRGFSGLRTVIGFNLIAPFSGKRDPKPGDGVGGTAGGSAGGASGVGRTGGRQPRL